jgi:hypothetical protein
MKTTTRRALYILLVILVPITFYSIFNMGNPNSLFRHIVPDPRYDKLITVGLAISMAAIGLILSSQATRDRSLEHMLDINADHIRQLKRQGRSDESIADEFLEKMGITSGGFLYRMARRRVLKHLSRME